MIQKQKERQMSKRICPYCYIEYKLSDLIIFCKKCGNQSTISELKFSDKMSLKVGVLPRLNYCVHCGSVKRSDIRYQCFNCKQDLPQDVIELKSKIISIVGGRGSGKTIYISLLINFIENNIKFGSNQTFTEVEGDKRDINTDIVSMIQHKLKVENSLPEPTLPREVKSDESTAGLPLIYFYKNNASTTVLSFYDSAGEDLQNYEALQQDYDYIVNSSGIIFIMDIFSGFEEFRNTKSSLINLMRLIRIEQSLHINTKISIPIAFVFNKFDLYKNEPLNERHMLWNGNNSIEILNEIDKLHNNLLEHFEDSSIEGLGNLLTICTENFKNFRFIPVSSLGYNPDDNIGTRDIKSFDIEYPYVYLLNAL